MRHRHIAPRDLDALFALLCPDGTGMAYVLLLTVDPPEELRFWLRFLVRFVQARPPRTPPTGR